MNNLDLFSSLSDSRLVAPLMERLGIHCDGVWYHDDLLLPQHLSTECCNEYPLNSIPCYRNDKLLLVLPEWIWTCDVDDFTLAFNFPKGIERPLTTEIRDLFQETVLRRGPSAITACCQLLVLLDKEGLLESI